MELPAEVLLLIVDQIADFGLWYRARFVCQAWLTRIVVEQDKKVWKFVKFHNNKFRLPNGVNHGLRVVNIGYIPLIGIAEQFYYYKYGKLIKSISCFTSITFHSIYSDILFDEILAPLRKIYMRLDNYFVIFHFEKSECISKICSSE